MIATVVLAIALAFTRWTPLVIGAAVVLGLWIMVYVQSDPMRRRLRGDDPAADAERRWNID